MINLKQLNTQALGVGFQDFVDMSDLIDVPNTEIVNRAQIANPANDLSAGFGVQRIVLQEKYLVQDEFGPNGEPVHGVVNDTRGLIRFVGGGWTSDNLVDGQRIYTQSTGDFVEITFYGTGLNILTYQDSTGGTITETTDGVTGGTTAVIGSSVLTSRNYAIHNIRNIKSGLALGTHTVSLELTSGSYIMFTGFEILNENASLVKVNPGTAYHELNPVASVASSLTYNSGFESGTLGTKGGHVLVYQKRNGDIKHAVTPTDATALYLTNADHSNEETIRNYNFREFGASRSDDFSESFSATPADLAFTLDDGTTTLVGNDVRCDTTGVYGTSSGSFVTITFVGTGLDVIIDSISGLTRSWESISIDGGSSIGSISIDTGIIGIAKNICSGLSYGTHTVKFETTSVSTPAISNFIVYGPKTPTLPNGAVAISDYYVMAEYSATTVGLEKVSAGVLRKDCSREMVYVGTWSVALGAPNYVGGFIIYSTTLSDYFEYTFYGTGFDFRWWCDTNQTTDARVTLNGTSLITSNFGTAVFSVSGTGVSYDSTTNGSLDMQSTAGDQRGAVFSCSSLPLGVYTVKILKNAAGTLSVDTIDVHTPIHSPKSNLPANYQNTLPVGSCALGDLRKFSPLGDSADVPNWAQAAGVESNPTTVTTSYVPCPDMQCVVKSEGNPLDISLNASFYNAALAGVTSFAVYVDGVQVSKDFRAHAKIAGSYIENISFNLVKNVGYGTHLVQAFWKASTSTSTLDLTNRLLSIKELK